uniref:NADH-ubiquinone oxidoreductase chain 1 n=1 Tax=Aleurochiton aceris TaxID=266942 RepID=Q6JCP8_ALEAC|nr:NADH dehydrogenase subunit 1 [Aleurochiton aceris]AAS77789.1 NADH dehydrogenase subunit 1 [Aleurochiton aceris]
MIIKIMNFIILMVSVMMSIAFFTLMERKIISYTQNRKGPNKVMMSGILQPISDAVKLVSKELNLNLKANFIIYLISPLLNLLMALMVWASFPFLMTFSFMKMSMLFMISCLSFNSITIMTMSWSSNSNYSFIGMMRSIAQLISYEINFMMIILTVMNICEQMSLVTTYILQKYISISLIMPMTLMVWMITILAETSRTPFDFSEGESELVSGFNIEYSSKSFMFLFLAEYSSILFMSFITVNMMIMTNQKVFTLMMYMTVCVFFIWTRSTLPRFRYDKLMMFNWIQLLPMTTVLLMISFMMKMY